MSDDPYHQQHPTGAQNPHQQQHFPPQQPHGAPPAGYQPHGAPPAGFPMQAAPPAGFPMQAAPPVKKRKKWPWIVAAVVLVSILGCIGAFTLFVGGAAKVVSEASNEMDKNQKGQNAVAGQMGKPARDGKFEFTVTGLKCGLDQVGPEFLRAKAQGEFCIVDVQVKNLGDTAETIVDSSQQAIDGNGNTYSVDTAAGISANGEASLFLESINPGNTAKGKLAFDVPAGTKLTAVVLHESMYTSGVKVSLE